MTSISNLRFVAPLALLLLAGILAACTGAQPAPTLAPTEIPPVEAEPSAAEPELITLYIGPSLADCTGVAPMKCMQVKRTPEGEFEFFYSAIEGFDYEEGYEYEIVVEVTEAENPPADASSLQYTLVEIVSKIPAPAIETAESSPERLAGVEWALVSYVDLAGETVAVLPGSEITIQFEDGQLGGHSGCNRYFGAYTLEGKSLTIGNIGSTMMACSDPLMQQEMAYLTSLGNAASLEFVDGQLLIADADGALLLTFQTRESLPLTGTLWQLVMVNNGRQAVVSLLQGTEITARFDEEGSLTGSAGCNNYKATYAVEGTTMQIGPAATTRMMCGEPQGVMEQEAQYLAALALVANFQIDGDRLLLTSSEGARLAEYRAVPDNGQEPEAAATAPDITGVVWQWTGSQYGNDSETVVDDPSRYTLELLPDGSAAIRADCNRVVGAYTLEEGSLTIQLGPTTTAACPPDSLDQVFLRDLSGAAAFVMDGDDLVINLMADAGNVRFVQEAAGSAAISADAVSIDLQGLAAFYQWQLVPATAYEANVPLGPVGEPQHLLMTFDNEAPEESARLVRIYPVAEYEQLWAAAGDDTIQTTIRQLAELLAARPEAPAPPLPILPPPGMSHVLAAQVAYLDLPAANATGIRFVGRLTLDASPTLSNQLSYFFQGLTGDGQFVISAIYPLTTSLLPDESNAEAQQQAEADFARLMQGTTDLLNGAAAEDFSPSLDLLDAMMESLKREG